MNGGSERRGCLCILRPQGEPQCHPCGENLQDTLDPHSGDKMRGQLTSRGFCVRGRAGGKKRPRRCWRMFTGLGGGDGTFPAPPWPQALPGMDLWSPQGEALAAAFSSSPSVPQSREGAWLPGWFSHSSGGAGPPTSPEGTGGGPGIPSSEGGCLALHKSPSWEGGCVSRRARCLASLTGERNVGHWWAEVPKFLSNPSENCGVGHKWGVLVKTSPSSCRRPGTQSFLHVTLCLHMLG